MQFEVKITADTFAELIEQLQRALADVLGQVDPSAARRQENDPVTPAPKADRRSRKIAVDKSELRADLDTNSATQAPETPAVAPEAPADEPFADPTADPTPEPEAAAPTHEEVRALAVQVASRHNGRSSVVVEQLQAIAGVKTVAAVPKDKLAAVRAALLAL